ncbi:MAG: hypothetical protein ABI648_16065, partial [Betaproteobacteria bacterium]
MRIGIGKGLLALLPLLTASLALGAPNAYVPNEGSGTVSVIDTSTDQVIKTIPAGKKPRGTAVSKDGTKLYVSDQPHNALV